MTTCAATNHNGSPCGAQALKKSNYCFTHDPGSSTASMRAPGQARMLPAPGWQLLGRSMEKRVEFRCSQDRLFETAMHLANQGKWPPNWSYHDLGLRNPLGFIELQVCRERLLKHRVTPTSGAEKLDLQFFRRVGKITFAGLSEHTSALIVRSEKTGLLRFFDELTTILSEHLLPQSPGAAKPAKPPQGSKLDDWFDYYHGMKRAGFKITFKMMQEESGYSTNTFKQAHARYKLQRGIS